MKIRKSQLIKLIQETKGSTSKYDDDSALRGKQSELPDGLQKGIIDKTVEDRDEAEETNEVRRLVRRLLREMEYGEFAQTPEVQAMLQAAGFNADGSFGQDGYPGPDDWSMYSPESLEDAEGWIQAALDMNDALRQAEAALTSGKFKFGEDAYYEIVHPVQRTYSKHGAADTEGREVAGDWLERAGFEWS